jgi:hypothetical protein
MGLWIRIQKGENQAKKEEILSQNTCVKKLTGTVR